MAPRHLAFACVTSVAWLIAIAACVSTNDLSNASSDAGEDREVDAADVTTSDAADAADAAPDVVVLGCGQAALGLVAYYPMDPDGGTLIRDCSGNQLNAALPDGGSFAPGHDGEALSLTGTPVFIGSPAALESLQAMTVAAWVYAPTLTQRQTIISRTGGTGVRGWTLEISDPAGSLAFTVSSDGNAEDGARLAGAAFTAGRWTHLAGVYDPGKSILLYIDGLIAASGDVVASSAFHPAIPTVIGGRSYNYYWKGLIDELRVYDRPLSGAEIAALAAR
jgi:hypothetical protein